MASENQALIPQHNTQILHVPKQSPMYRFQRNIKSFNVRTDTDDKMRDGMTKKNRQYMIHDNKSSGKSYNGIETNKYSKHTYNFIPKYNTISIQ